MMVMEPWTNGISFSYFNSGYVPVVFISRYPVGWTFIAHIFIRSVRVDVERKAYLS